MCIGNNRRSDRDVDGDIVLDENCGLEEGFRLDNVVIPSLN